MSASPGADVLTAVQSNKYRQVGSGDDDGEKNSIFKEDPRTNESRDERKLNTAKRYRSPRAHAPLVCATRRRFKKKRRNFERLPLTVVEYYCCDHSLPTAGRNLRVSGRALTPRRHNGANRISTRTPIAVGYSSIHLFRFSFGFVCSIFSFRKSREETVRNIMMTRRVRRPRVFPSFGRNIRTFSVRLFVTAIVSS